MMHGREKSDSAIVAGKPTNKAEQSAAEPAEPRAEAKGNTSQQSTRRAQDRESVSQALERIRQAARQRKKEKFTSLFHHLSIDLLEHAFSRTQTDAAAGRRWSDMAGLRSRPRTQSRGTACASPPGSISGTAKPASVHTEAGWPAAPARGRRSGRQDRPKSDGAVLNAIYEEDFLGFSYGFPARTRHA